MEYHQPVMVKEVLQILQPGESHVVVDCNLGTGGHSLALLEASGSGCFLIGMDLDQEMLALAEERFRSEGIDKDRYALVHANHGDLGQVLEQLGKDGADRILMDLGTCSLHFDDAQRGFSFQSQGPLDMRYDRSSDGPTAADLVNGWSEANLADLIFHRGDERWARRIAKRIVERRGQQAFESTGDLAEFIGQCIPRGAWPKKIHPATRTFLALRVEVNGEEQALREGLDKGLELLRPAGRLAVLSFQGNEDRIVKKRFREVCRDVIDEADPFGRVTEKAGFIDLTRKPLRPGEEEISQNPRSRSTRLRAVEKKQD